MNFLLEAFNAINRGDEFYTRYNDVSRELRNYNLSNMTVYCNCDNPESSNFVKYFKNNFKQIGLKELLVTFNTSEPNLYRYNGIETKLYKIKSGRFQDNYDIISMSDIVITNPPFSNGMAIEMLNTLLKSGKKFIIVAPLTIILKKGILNYFNNGILKTGYTSIGKFNSPEGDTIQSSTIWLTNMDVNKSSAFGIKYDERNYIKYDNFDAIDCSKSSMIPINYDGYIGVPLSFISKFNPNEYNIVGILNKPILEGKSMMSRLIIKKK